MGRKKGIPGLSFSWKRAVGISGMKRSIARATGIPTTKSGRRRKAGATMGCLIPMSIGFLTIISIILIF